MEPKITDSQIGSLLAALEALEPSGQYSEADRVFEATKPILEAKLREGCSPRQIIDSFRTEGIPLGQRRVASFVRSLGPKKRRRPRTRRAAVLTAAAVNPTPGSPAAAVSTPQPPAPPAVKPRVEPPKPPQAGSLFGTTPSSHPVMGPSTKRRSNSSLGDHY